MRKFFSFHMITVDGFHAGPADEFDFAHVDAEFNEFSHAQLAEIDTIVFGRRTYEGMVEWWTSEHAAQTDPVTTRLMTEADKIVVSTTLDEASWKGTRLVRDLDGLAEAKAGDGGPLAVFGSAGLTVSLVEAGLLDELRIIVNPIGLGAGKSLFAGAKDRLALELAQTRVFASGNVMLTYRVGRRP
jgi:dihydrofolate reductase